MKRLIIATLLLGSISPLPAQKSMKIPEKFNIMQHFPLTDFCVYDMMKL